MYGVREHDVKSKSQLRQVTSGDVPGGPSNDYKWV